ncbi:MAG: hypothetical protein JWP01_1511 [Myxococcales bacterium]|nr:hypothetical protein [Myxococcales bacterium]
MVGLDVGSDDGVSTRHQAALIDARGNPVTAFAEVKGIQRRRCIVELEIPKEALANAANFVVMTSPPKRKR